MRDAHRQERQGGHQGGSRRALCAGDAPADGAVEQDVARPAAGGEQPQGHPDIVGGGLRAHQGDDACRSAHVKAGGQPCPIRFQCSGCDFYRPDPSYLPAIEDHIRSLKADREAADAIGAAPFVLDNLNAQVESFREVASTMRHQLDELSEDERQEIEEASKTLRKARATQSHKLLPLTVVNQRKETP